MSSTNHKVDRCLELARRAAQNPAAIGAMSGGERRICALLHNRMDWLIMDGQHPLTAIDMLDEEWQAALLKAHRMGWQEG